ncbi:hypothetical protein BDD43_2350 [Mucilaginibacter gracilis]|uniref:Uncharacterized protein n=1 Tax=Mucilaginibacter gracilis TaxID=423350 RepID=A0A495J2D8_9SPHI|nr:hypothetical protein [Mucilaginibacter gracilis]RKR82179.1 hypothetical protein BDD43_2350 [Mucilaginibacter gracilis]
MQNRYFKNRMFKIVVVISLTAVVFMVKIFIGHLFGSPALTKPRDLQTISHFTPNGFPPRPAGKIKFRDMNMGACRGRPDLRQLD